MPRFETLNALLGADAREDRHITFIEGERDQRTLSFARLRQRALGALGALQRRGLSRGDPMILYVADNERFVEMFWACILGGIVPVPLAPGNNDEHWRKLFRVFAQLETAWVCIDASSLDRLDAFATAQGLGTELQALRSRIVIAGGLDVTGEPGAAARPDSHDLAFIQYSSGSTGQPKGVLVTHHNLTMNIDSISEGAAYTDQDSVLSWMPLSHDMGLIGFHLTLLSCNTSHAIMRTELFARRPLLWLEIASQRRATVLCSPNFGFQHYLRQYEIKAPQNLDLSSIRMIMNGAEPISAEVCRRFMRAMAPHGLRSQSMLAVYGLAEATLAVSFQKLGVPIETVQLDPASVLIGEVARDAVQGSGRAVEFVKVGQPLPGIEARVVDDADTPLPNRVLGHVQIRGENVTEGYHLDTQRSAALHSSDGWLKTGDLGLFWDGQLVITGRAKDLIIINGQNHYPHDLERIAQQVTGIEANRVAAAGVRSLADETETLALFVLHRGELADFVPQVLQLRQTVLQQTGLDATHVVPVRNIPKTSSGKLQRYSLAEAFERGEFDEALNALSNLLEAHEAQRAAGGQPNSTLSRLRSICRPFVSGHDLTAATNLMEINLNSLTLARIHEAIEREFPRRVEVTDLFDYPALGQLAEFLDGTGDRQAAT